MAHSEGPVDVQTSQRNNYDRGDFLPTNPADLTTNPGDAFLASAADHDADRAFGRDSSRRHHSRDQFVQADVAIPVRPWFDDPS